jgi:hypothetical protein
MHKIGWATLALVAPEVVLWRAISQWEAARKLRDAMNSIFENKWENSSLVNSDPSQTREGAGRAIISGSKWCLQHGFFAVMGGFEVSVDFEHKYLLDYGSTLTPRGVLLLAKLDLLPFVKREIISARSKADGLAKGLVIAQVGWMVLQISARAASRLPITLLELNTMAHVACALAMYAIWWEKPQNVNEPIIINLDPKVMTIISSHYFQREFRKLTSAETVSNDVRGDL